MDKRTAAGNASQQCAGLDRSCVGATPVDINGHLYRFGGYRKESQKKKKSVVTSFVNVLTRSSMSPGCCDTKPGMCSFF